MWWRPREAFGWTWRRRIARLSHSPRLRSKFLRTFVFLNDSEILQYLNHPVQYQRFFLHSPLRNKLKLCPGIVPSTVRTHRAFPTRAKGRPPAALTSRRRMKGPPLSNVVNAHGWARDAAAARSLYGRGSLWRRRVPSPAFFAARFG